MKVMLARIVWGAVGVLGLTLAAAGAARADTIYFKNGTSVWGEEAEEEGDQVYLTRGGQTLTFPKADVDRIEKKRTNMPDYRVDVPPPPAAGQPPGGGAGSGLPGALPGGPAAGQAPAFNPAGPSGQQGAIPIPGGEVSGPPPSPYGPPGGGPSPGPPGQGGLPPGGPQR